MVDLSGVKVAILVADGFEQVEFVEPKKALEKAGATTEVISLKKGEVQGVNHGEKADRFPVDKTLTEVSEATNDGVPYGRDGPEECGRAVGRRFGGDRWESCN